MLEDAKSFIDANLELLDSKSDRKSKEKSKEKLSTMRDGGVDHEISALLNSLASVGDSMEHSSDTNIALVVDDENMNVFSMRE